MVVLRLPPAWTAGSYIRLYMRTSLFLPCHQQPPKVEDEGEENVPEQFECSICMKLLVEPVT
eukprot:2172294-Amphidinium_carterae.1